MHNPSRPVDICLTLVIPPTLEDAMVDFLLAHSDAVGHFTSRPVDAHGNDLDYASAAEQVRGRARRMRLQALMASGDVHQLLRELQDQFKGADLFYWTTPVLETGQI